MAEPEVAEQHDPYFTDDPAEKAQIEYNLANHNEEAAVAYHEENVRDVNAVAAATDEARRKINNDVIATAPQPVVAAGQGSDKATPSLDATLDQVTGTQAGTSTAPAVVPNPDTGAPLQPTTEPVTPSPLSPVVDPAVSNPVAQ